MNIYEILFIVDLFFMLALVGFEAYNAMSLFKVYSIKASFLMFASYFVAYLFNLIVVLMNPEIIVYSQIHKLFTGIMGLHTLLFFLNLLFHLKSNSTKVIRPYMARDNF